MVSSKSRAGYADVVPQRVSGIGMGSGGRIPSDGPGGRRRSIASKGPNRVRVKFHGPSMAAWRIWSPRNRRYTELSDVVRLTSRYPYPMNMSTSQVDPACDSMPLRLYLPGTFPPAPECGPAERPRVRVRDPASEREGRLDDVGAVRLRPHNVLAVERHPDGLRARGEEIPFVRRGDRDAQGTRLHDGERLAIPGAAGT